jgi:hypothetical protein
VIELSLFVTTEVAPRNHADHASATHYREMPVATVLHHSKGFKRIGVGLDVVGTMSHHLGKSGARRIELGGDDAIDEIPLGEYAFEAAAACDDHGSTSLRLHQAGSLEHRRVRWQLVDFLVLYRISNSSEHDEPPADALSFGKRRSIAASASMSAGD